MLKQQAEFDKPKSTSWEEQAEVTSWSNKLKPIGVML
jgi:hypothetical protein